MMFAPNPWVILAVVLFYFGSIGAASWKAYHVGQAELIAEMKQDEDVRAKERAAVLSAVAEAVSKIEVKHVTIRQKAETITREVPVYSDCRHDPDGLRLVNDALRSGPTLAPDPRKLSGADPAAR